MDIGRNVKAAREARGLSIGEVARRTGLTFSGIASVETGRVKRPSVETVVRIARAVGVDPCALLANDPKDITVEGISVNPKRWVKLASTEDLVAGVRAINTRLRAVSADTRGPGSERAWDAIGELSAVGTLLRDEYRSRLDRSRTPLEGAAVVTSFPGPRHLITWLTKSEEARAEVREFLADKLTDGPVEEVEEDATSAELLRAGALQ